MTPSERLRDAFARYDRDGNGLIDQDEFCELLKEVGANLSPSEAQAAFADIDADQEGGISLDEFAAWWKTPG